MRPIIMTGDIYVWVDEFKVIKGCTLERHCPDTIIKRLDSFEHIVNFGCYVSSFNKIKF